MQYNLYETHFETIRRILFLQPLLKEDWHGKEEEATFTNYNLISLAHLLNY